MNYIVLDLEWNQASDDKTKQESPLLFEIVEIGAKKLNSKREQIDSFHEMIKPQVFKKMNQITSELIHLQMEDLQNCRSFQEVVRDFLSWCGEDYIFCTWGNLDLYELQRNITFYHLPDLSDKPIPFYDVQKLFSIAYEDKKLRRTLEFAVDYLHIKKDVTFHRADSDAYYTAKVMEKITDEKVFENYSYDIYHIPQRRKDEVHVIFEDYEKYISRAFIDRNEILEDPEVIANRCFLCNRDAKKKIKWFTMNNGKHYYSVSHCRKHGFIKSKIRIRKSIDNHVYVVKTTRMISKSEVEELLYRKEKTKQIKKERERRVKEQKKQKKI